MARRHEVLAVIKDHKRKTRGDGPSYRVLLGELKRSGYKMCLATVRRHVRQLVDDGLLEDPEENGGRIIVTRSAWLDEQEDSFA
jgi:Fe2+ or Zn2+ uptake regulation protein